MYTVRPMTNTGQEFTLQDPRAFACAPKLGLAGAPAGLAGQEGGLDRAVRGSRGKPQQGPFEAGRKGLRPQRPLPLPDLLPGRHVARGAWLEPGRGPGCGRRGSGWGRGGDSASWGKRWALRRNHDDWARGGV